MTKDFKIIVSNTDCNPYTSLSVNNSFEIENHLGFLSGFDYSLLCRYNFLDSISEQTIKLVLNICKLPHTCDIYISDRLKNQINSDKNTFLWIFSPHEATLDHNNFAVELKKRGFNLDKIVITNSDNSVDGKIIAGIKYVSFPEWWEAYYRHLVRTKDDISFTTPNERKNYLDSLNKKSLCLNRNLKIHRIWTYYYLLETGLFNESYYSYHLPMAAQKDGVDLKEWIIDELKKYNSRFAAKDVFKKTQIFKNHMLDSIDERFVINLQSEIKKYFDKSAVSIVTESLENHDFLTEKTFKTIIHSHPFITIGGTGIGERLKERGYQLFDDIFGFEHIDNPQECQQMMAKIKNYSMNDLRFFNKNEINNRITHNYNHFFNRKINFIDFLNKLESTLNEKK